MLTEEEKKEIAKKQVQNKKLSKMLFEGTAYHEPCEVKCTNGETYQVTIRPLGEGEILQAYRAGGVSLGEFGDATEAKKKLEEIILVQHQLIAKAATGDKDEVWTADEIGRFLKFGESFPLARRILEISGLFGPEVAELKSFREGKNKSST
jgi:hypothetical protein